MKRTVPGGGFLVIEGIDGAGKSTQAQLVAEALEVRGLDVVRTREPTDRTMWGRRLRDLAMIGRLAVEEEVELFIKDREAHVRELIIPALEAGKIVICDRYYLSTVAYQGSRGVSIQMLLERNEAFAPRPDLAVILDLEPEQAIARLEARGRSTSFEQLETLKRCREIYRKINRPYLIVLDATWDANELRDAILFEFSRRLIERWASDRRLSYQARLQATLDFHGAPR